MPMGMFDEVVLDHELFGSHKGEKHQTKSLDSMGSAFELYESPLQGGSSFWSMRLKIIAIRTRKE